MRGSYEVFEKAKRTIYLVDNYISIKTLALLKYAPASVVATVFTDNKGRGVHSTEVADFRMQYPHVNVIFRDAGNKVHDRYIAIDYNTDDEMMYQCGASLKDAGLRCTSAIRLRDTFIWHELFDMLLEESSELDL